MPAPYVTGAAILTHAGADAGGVTPTPDDEAWADVCAAAIEAEIADRLVDVTLSATQEDAVTRAALDDGAAAYARRRAPHGVLSIGPDGQAVRLGADVLLTLKPVLRRISPGIG